MQNLLLSLVDIKLRSFGGFESLRTCRALCSCQGASGSRVPGALEAGCRGWIGARGALQDALPRKEVIQPHLPVRLPCYDFTPLTLHTFGASPPIRLGRRLRVQTTRVV